MSVVLSRSARSARMTAHYDLDFPKEPKTEPYHCYKHSRVCSPTREAYKFLRRYTLDTIRRIKEYERLRKPVSSRIFHADARTLDYGSREFHGMITSPPYPGRIDYHEQHRYAFELLGLDDLRPRDRRRGEGVAAQRDRRLRPRHDRSVHQRSQHSPIGLFVIVIDDSRGLYDQILQNAGLTLVERRKRHVNRRTGRRQASSLKRSCSLRPDRVAPTPPHTLSGTRRPVRPIVTRTQSRWPHLSQIQPALGVSKHTLER